MYRYFVCAVCPVKAPTLELRYDHDLNEFHPGSTGHIALAPELGFLYPAFDSRAANIYDLLFYAKNPAELHQEVIDALFRVEPPMSAAEQKNVFDTALTEALDEACSYDVVQSVHEQIRAKIEDHKESHDPEPLELTVSDVGCILANSGVDTEKVDSVQSKLRKAVRRKRRTESGEYHREPQVSGHHPRGEDLHRPGKQLSHRDPDHRRPQVSPDPRR